MSCGAMKTAAQTSAARIQMPACASIAVPADLSASTAGQICYQPRTRLICNPRADCVTSPGLPRRGSSSSVVVVGSCSGMPVADAMVLERGRNHESWESRKMMRSLFGWRQKRGGIKRAG